jgi:hypothetical protein
MTGILDTRVRHVTGTYIIGRTNARNSQGDRTGKDQTVGTGTMTNTADPEVTAEITLSMILE